MLKYLFAVLIFAGVLTLLHLVFIHNTNNDHHHQLSSPLDQSQQQQSRSSIKSKKTRMNNNNKKPLRHTPIVEDGEEADNNDEKKQHDENKQHDHQNQNCKSLPLHKNATKPGIGVSQVLLCWQKSKCSGHIKISVTGQEECANPVKKPTSLLSSNAELRQDILRRGPHQFRLRLEGTKETLTIPPSEHRFVFSSSSLSSSSCNYYINIPKSKFRIFGSNTRFRLGLEMLFRNYAYLDEARDVWPELLKVPLLPIDDDFVKTTKYHLQQCTLPSSRKEVPELECEVDHHDNNKAEQLPICDGVSETSTDGTWKRIIIDSSSSPQNNINNNNFVSTRVRVRKIRKEPILFEWALQKEPEVRWWPRHCRIQPVSREEIFEKYGGKRIVIAGDSQLRALYYATVNTLLGNGEQCVRNITTQQNEPRECVANVKGSQRKSLSLRSAAGAAGAGAIQVDYIDDLFLNRIKQKLGYNYDVIICGFGQHPASKEHWRFGKYSRAVDQRMAQLKSIVGGGGGNNNENDDNDEKKKKRQKTKKKVIWYTAPHYPHTRKGYPVVVKDWRTDSRLELFNNYSSKVAKENGFAVLDSFAISDAFMHTSPDQAHFSNFVAAEFVRMLFSML